MPSRPTRAPALSPFALPLRPYFLRLARARFRLAVEHAVWIFTKPVLFATGFYTLALTGIFGRLFTFFHVAALALFGVLFVQALGRAYQPWRPRRKTVRAYVIARSAYEKARGQRYRLPDILDDQPGVSLDAFDQPQLAAARLMVELENALPLFALPLGLVLLFVALAWLGVFPALYPWAHLAALVLFTCLFFDGLHYAHKRWRKRPDTVARRRVEQASGLRHRPLDVLDDRPAVPEGAALGEDQLALWQAHSFRARAQTRYLDWPRWSLNGIAHDPYALRYALLILLGIGALAGWGAWGGRLVAAINPALGRTYSAPAALDAWITPPAYTKLPPIMIATPAGLLHDKDEIEVPQGSIFSAHLAEREGDTPTLTANGIQQDFAAPDAKDFSITVPLESGDTLSITRGWQRLGQWHIRLIEDQPPQIAFDDTPSVTARQSIRLSYTAHDDYGVATVALRVTPRQSAAGVVSAAPFDIDLSAPGARDAKRIAFADLTAHPASGLAVQLQLVATDEAGHRSVSQPVDFVLPERIFLNPYAHALSEQRKKLLQRPLDDALRNESANLMAGIAHQPTAYREDPLVALALRAGAVRLVLEPTAATVASVADILWQTALRIEDGATGEAEQNLRAAQKDLADALDHNAPEAEIQRKIDRLHQALNQYLAEMATRLAARPAAQPDLGIWAGQKTNSLTPQDLGRMLNNMRDLSAAGARDAARAELSRLQQILENLRSGPAQLSPQQKADLEKLKSLRQLVDDQQKLLDRTFQAAHASSLPPPPADRSPLSATQQDLLKRLQSLIGKPAEDEGSKNLSEGAQAMSAADGALHQGAMIEAVTAQGQALQALKQAADSMASKLQQSMLLLPVGGTAQGSDPLGRDGTGTNPFEDGKTLPDRIKGRRVQEILNELQRRAGEADRPKPERDYIDRLLQDF